MSAVIEYLDLALLVIMLGVGLSFSVLIMDKVQMPIVSYTEDKTALDAGEISDTKRELIGTDILQSLVVTGEYGTFPNAIKINETSVIHTDKAWVTNKYGNISAVLSESGQWKLRQMLEWKVKSIEYVDDGIEKYMHYVLEEA